MLIDWCRPGTREQSWQAERGLHSRSASSLHSTHEQWGPKWETWLLFNSTPACGLDESTKGPLGGHSSITRCYRPQIPNTKTIRYWLRFSGPRVCLLFSALVEGIPTSQVTSQSLRMKHSKSVLESLLSTLNSFHDKPLFVLAHVCVYVHSHVCRWHVHKVTCTGMHLVVRGWHWVLFSITLFT